MRLEGWLEFKDTSTVSEVNSGQQSMRCNVNYYEEWEVKYRAICPDGDGMLLTIYRGELVASECRKD